MRLDIRQAPRPLLQLITAILLTPRHTSALPNVGFSLDELFARDCTPCGYYNQLCCTAGQTCGTNANNEAVCSASSAGITAAGSGGSWTYWVTTTVETDLVTRTITLSSYIPAAATATPACAYSNNETPCGSICCASGQYCYSSENSQCMAAAASGSSGYYSGYTTPGATAGAPLRPTSSGYTQVTATVSPTTTVAFIAPVPTGANVTLTGEQRSGGGGLSGGAIAGIVIGVLVGLALLALLCFYCCLKGLLDGCLACFGLGKKKRRTEVEEYERYSHHDSRHGSRPGGRTWYGAARPPARVDRTERRSSSGKGLLGIGAGLAALWAILGLKRKRDNRRDEKYSEYSYSSDYYTSASSASSDDRRTRTYRSASRR